MKPTIREIIKARDLDALARFINESFDLSLSHDRVRSILEQAVGAGGPADDPWSDSTWRMWLKGKATQMPREVEETAAQSYRDLETVLTKSSAGLLTTADFEICDVSGWDDLLDEFDEDPWAELFPVAESIGGFFKEQFDERGARDWLGKAPFASWLYARLAFLGIGNVDEENDLGGYQTRFLIKANNRPVALLSIDADSDCVELFLEAQTADLRDKIKEQFTGLLVKDVKEIARCELEVHGAEADWTNCYGWTGEYFLGHSNVSG